MSAATYPPRVVMEAIRDWILEHAEDPDRRKVDFREGQSELDWREATPPRYVWFPTTIGERDRDEVAVAPDAADIGEAGDMGPVEAYGEPVDVDVIRVQVHAWGNDDADAWAMYREVRRAIKDMTLTRAVTFQGGQFPKPESGIGGGSVFVFQLDLHTPLTMAPDATVVVTTTDGSVFLDRTGMGGQIEEGC